MKKYARTSLIVKAQKYEPGQNMEDGFIPWTQIITNGWVVSDGLIQIHRPDGTVVCPFISNRRGMIFIRKGDYIIYENDGERHVCGADKFEHRFTPQE